MSKKINLPSLAEVEKMFKMLTGANTVVQASDKWIANNFSGSYVATYQDDNKSQCAYCIIDLQAGASTAAALTKIPPARTSEIITSGKLDEILFENLGEVLNISASLLNKDNFKHVVYKEVKPYIELKESLELLLSQPHNRIDVKLHVENYHPGKLTFISQP